MNKTNILVVEDESIVALDLENGLRSLGYSVPALASSGEEAIQKAAETRPDLVLMDIRLRGDMDGVEAAGEIRARFDIPVVYLTAFADDDIVRRARSTEPYGYLIKPFEERQLHTTVEMALHKHRMEKALRESERRYRLLAENVTDVIWTADTNLQFTYISPSVSHLLGYSVEEVMAQTMEERLTPASLEVAREAFAKVLAVDDAAQEGLFRSRTLDLEFTCKDGSTVWTGVKATLLCDPDGRPVGILGVTRDITERKRAEETLRRRAAELEALARVSSTLRAAQTVEEILSIVLEQTTQAIAATLRQAQGGLFGSIFLVEPETGDLVAQATHPPDLHPLGKRHHLGQSIIGHVAATGKVHISKDLANDPLACIRSGEAQYLSTVGGSIALPLRTQERSVGVMNITLRERRPFAAEEVRLLTAIADIAANALHRALVMEGLEAEVAVRTAEIRAEREKSETILRSVGDAIVMTDLERRIQYVNEAFTTLTGHSAAEVLGRQVESLIEEVFTTLSEQAWQSLQPTPGKGEALQKEVTIRRKDGRTYDAALTIAPMRDAASNLVGYVSSHRDISRLKDLDRARSRFITNVSHELRTPVTVLQTAIYLLRKGRRPKEIYLQMMEEATARLIHLIKDILEMTVLDSGQAVTIRRPVSLSTVIGDIVTRYRAQAKVSGLTLVALPIPPDLPAMKGDQDRLIQALGEIVENAIVFTPAGGQVTVKAGTVEDEGRLWVTVGVRDTGPGISPEEQEKVFDRFFRGSLAELGLVPGTGLGLSIAQEIMRAHGGRVTVESPPSVPPPGGEGKGGDGSIFRMWLPYQTGSERHV